MNMTSSQTVELSNKKLWIFHFEKWQLFIVMICLFVLSFLIFSQGFFSGVISFKEINDYKMKMKVSEKHNTEKLPRVKEKSLPVLLLEEKGEQEISKVSRNSINEHNDNKENISLVSDSNILLSEKKGNDLMGFYSVQIGSFRNKIDANEFVTQLINIGYDAYSYSVSIPNMGKWHRVRIGTYKDLDGAINIKNKLVSAGYNPLIFKN